MRKGLNTAYWCPGWLDRTRDCQRLPEVGRESQTCPAPPAPLACLALPCTACQEAKNQNEFKNVVGFCIWTIFVKGEQSKARAFITRDSFTLLHLSSGLARGLRRCLGCRWLMPLLERMLRLFSAPIGFPAEDPWLAQKRVFGTKMSVLKRRLFL